MPIQEPESLQFASYVLELWKKRWAVCLGAIVCMAITAVYVQFIAKEQFRSFAQIMIKDPPQVIDEERSSYTPISYQHLLFNDKMLRDVRDDFAAQAVIDPNVLKIEKFKNLFEIKTNVVQDTTLRKEFSPVIVLSADSDSPANARLLMETWLRHFMQGFSELQSRRMAFFSRTYGKKIQDIETQINDKEREFTTIRWQLPFKMRRLTSLEMLIAPAPAQLPSPERRRSYYRYRGDTAVDVATPEILPAELKDGLQARLTDAEISLAAAKAAGDAAETGRIEASIEALKAEIQSLSEEIAGLQKETADMEFRYQQLSREITALKDQYQYAADIYNQADADAAGLRHEGKGGPSDVPESIEDLSERGDIMVVSQPSLPEMRVFPKKSLSCMIAGIVGLLLSIIAVTLDKFMRDSRQVLREGSPS